MRLNIAVCEDNDDEAEFLIRQINKSYAKFDITARTDRFCSGEEFLAANNKRGYDIVFMDIYLGGITGIEAARSVPPNCRIVFITTSTDHAVEAFNLNAEHYIVKPATQESVIEAVDRCLASFSEKATKTLSVKSGKKIIRIPMESIVYIEVTDKRCVIHTENDSYQTYTSLNALYEFLDENYFIRAQKSFAVNMNFIESFFYNRVVLRGGMEIYLSRNNRAELKKSYQRFLFDRVRGNGL